MNFYSAKQIEKRVKRRNKIKMILGWVFYPIIAIILIASIILIMQKIENPQKATSVFGIKAYTVSSGSMEPALNVGDLIFTKEAEEEQIRRGDIISYNEDGFIVTHRIVDIVTENGKKYYQTKGDNNNVKDDKLVSYEELEGVYVIRIPLAGRIATKAQSPKGIVTIAIMTYMIYEIISIKEERKICRHEKRKKYEEQHEAI